MAARSSGPPLPPKAHRKQSVASLSGSRGHRNSQDASKDRRSSLAAAQGAPLRRKAAMVREVETVWYLKTLGLGREDSVACRTGMPYR